MSFRNGTALSDLYLALVFEDGHGGVSSVDADYAAAGVGACSAEIEALHGCAGGEAIGPEVLRETFALEDVAACEADFLLDVGWAEDLGVDDGGGEIGAEAGDGIQS